MAYDSYDMNHIIRSYVEPYMVHMRGSIEYVETKSVLKSQLYPILDDKDSLYLKLTLALEHTL